MPLIKKEGNILEDAELDCIVNPVNVVGVMGAGLALELKKLYPFHFEIYRDLCENKYMHCMGGVRLISSGISKPHGIIVFPTKKHWKDKSDIAVIEFNLKRLCDLLLNQVLPDDIIGLPAVGCGLGGLNPGDVFDLASFYLKDTKQEVRWYQK